MSPWFDGVWPGWVDFFGGRQSARTIHFICAWLIVLFVAIHVFQVIITGLWNNLRSMITGRYRVTTYRRVTRKLAYRASGDASSPAHSALPQRPPAGCNRLVHTEWCRRSRFRRKADAVRRALFAARRAHRFSPSDVADVSQHATSEPNSDVYRQLPAAVSLRTAAGGRFCDVPRNSRSTICGRCRRARRSHARLRQGGARSASERRASAAVTASFKPQPRARFVVFYAPTRWSATDRLYYETSIWTMPITSNDPRVRVERQPLPIPWRAGPLPSSVNLLQARQY